ncbi:TonB-dependent receptor plug domain-containing protein [Fulvivirga imtechensis]|nr:TonB-dependent receptor plug domain-containing protein [Fulvivirga imtechensis]
MLKHLLLTLAILTGSLNLFAQAEYEEKLSNYLFAQRQEKIYLHLDKPHYGAGDEVWLKAYIVDGTFHTPTEISGTLFIELISPEKKIIDSLLLPIRDGVSIGNFTLSRNLRKGNYGIRAYTNWMRNFDQDFLFKKSIEVINPLKKSTDTLNCYQNTSEPIRNTIKSIDSDLQVDFLPEGGDLIDGISTKVAVKATDALGRGVSFTGRIIDNSGEFITEIKSNKFGHGLFFMTPSLESTYTAIINADTFNLRKVKKYGASIRVLHNFQSDRIQISVLSNGVDLSGGSLVAHQRGGLLFSTQCQQESSFSTILSKENFSSGIIHLTFFNTDGIPLSERLIFPNVPSGDSVVKIKPKQSLHKTRSKIIVEFSALSDSVHSASVTINPLEDLSLSGHEENIVSYLLLSSDIKGRIESPSYYFHNTDTSYEALDLLMLTQGWTRFNWESLLNNNDFSMKFLPEKGITIRGQITDYYNESQFREANFTYMVPLLGINETGRTDKNGRFVVEGNDFQDSTMVVIKAHGFKGKKNKEDKNVRVNLTPLPRPEIKSPLIPNTGINSMFITKVTKLDQISRAYRLDNETTLLDEVVISAKHPVTEQLQERTSLYTEPSHRLFIDSMKQNIGTQSVFDLLEILPGVRVSGSWPDLTVNIRGAISTSTDSEPLFVIDGIPVDKDAIVFLPIQSVEFIDVLKGPKASVYGSRAAGGVILVYTRQGGPIFFEKEDPKGILGFMHPGYTKSKEFYSPQYDRPREEHIVPDYRSTLFWEPDLQFNNNKAQLTFYSSDQKGTYLIQLEGILKNGEPVYEKMTLEVE